MKVQTTRRDFLKLTAAD
ncbi:twin-arginine translocation signal domain-containing protein [Vibrio cholerae]|nr:twin-arginine translocation signal domain-containing protein [Vibrio cholerae]MBG8952921.1 twin-arginine translocation signal domain-containing protein [Vibrio cholerae]